MIGPCEAGIGVDDTGPGISIIKCGEPGILRKEVFGPFGVILCDQCYTTKKKNMLRAARRNNIAAVQRLGEEDPMP